MKKIAFVLILLTVGILTYGQEFQLESPDGRLQLSISADQSLHYRLSSDDTVLIQASEIALITDKFDSRKMLSSLQADKQEGREIYRPYWGICDSINSHYRLLNLQLSPDLLIEFRLYNYGMAWRYIADYSEDLTIQNEIAEFNFPKNTKIWFPEVEGFHTPFEPSYDYSDISDIEAEKTALPPLLAEVSNYRLLLAEANLFDYPGMFLEKTTQGFSGIFAAYPKKEKEQILGRLRLINIPQLSKMMVKKRENYMARTSGSRNFPFRAILINRSDKELISNTLISELATSPKRDFSWVKPGKVVWDWYHKWNFPDTDFKAGINTETYKYMIDFAARNGIEYINIDDGWSPLHNFDKVNKNLDLPEVLAYAEENGVGVFIWCVWQSIENPSLEENLDKFKAMGVAGLKVDFFDRNDQRVVGFVEQLADEAAKRKLLLNLHGMYPPSGLSTTYPNIVNVEAVLGLEYNKFSDRCTPRHNLTIPFVRNTAGPMDYTPGGMRHIRPEEFEKSWGNPHVMSSRAQQAAMYIIYHGGLQMLADSPVFFKRDSLMLNFIKHIPVSWDEVKPISGKIGEYIVLARRKGDVWYLAGMTADKAQSFELPLTFLPEGNFEMQLLEDGNSLSELSQKTQIVNKNTVLNMRIKALGGFAARIVKK